jgi:hypothetical protein
MYMTNLIQFTKNFRKLDEQQAIFAHRVAKRNEDEGENFEHLL